MASSNASVRCSRFLAGSELLWSRASRHSTYFFLLNSIGQQDTNLSHILYYLLAAIFTINILPVHDLECPQGHRCNLQLLIS